MKYQFSWLDHVVIGVPDLKFGIEHIEKLTGCRPIVGGKHEQFGTQNALLKIGNLLYLEILAPDPDNPKTSKLWMGLSEIEKPTITRYAVRSSNIARDADILRNYDVNLGTSKVGKRTKLDGKTLKWELSVPLPLPKISCVPFLIDWGKTEHPSISLESDCKLIKFDCFSPDYAKQNVILAALNIESLILPGKERIVLSMECPNGIIELS